MAYRVGSKLQITTDDGQYIGVLHLVDTGLGKLTLGSVTCVDSGKSFSGLLNFYSKEIIEVIVLEDNKPTESPPIEIDSGKSLLQPKVKHPHLDKLKRKDNMKFVISRVLEEKQNVNTEYGKGTADNSHATSKQKTERESQSFPEISYTVISCFDDTFNEAIVHIEKHNIIGLSAEGIDMGRNGCLCWLGIATSEETFLFDIIQLGGECFSRGLSSILQSGSIQKVTHDCRRLSDLLHHEYSTDLVNVFDTQVAFVIIHHSKTGQFPHYVEPLSNLLHTILDIDRQLIHFSQIRMTHALEDQRIWCHRPATQKMLRAIAKNVMHLIRLRQELLQMMLANFIKGVDIYLSCIRDRDDSELGSNQMSSKHILPAEFSKLQVGRSHSSHRDNTSHDRNGFKENLVGTPRFFSNRTNQSMSADQKEGKRQTGQSNSSDRSVSGQRTNRLCTSSEQAHPSDKESSARQHLSDSTRQIASMETEHLPDSPVMVSLIAAGNEIFARQSQKRTTETHKATLPTAELLQNTEVVFDCIPESVEKQRNEKHPRNVLAAVHKGQEMASSNSRDLITHHSTLSPQKICSRSESRSVTLADPKLQWTKRRQDDVSSGESSGPEMSPAGDGGWVSLSDLSDERGTSVQDHYGHQKAKPLCSGEDAAIMRSADKADQSPCGIGMSGGTISLGRGWFCMDDSEVTNALNPEHPRTDDPTSRPASAEGRSHDRPSSNDVTPSVAGCLGRGRPIVNVGGQQSHHGLH